MATALTAAGCAVRVYHRLLARFIGRFGRDHRKILLVDDEVAFVGGINIGDENLGQGTRLGWADLALEIRGPQCAHLGQMIRREPQRARVRSDGSNRRVTPRDCWVRLRGVVHIDFGKWVDIILVRFGNKLGA